MPEDVSTSLPQLTLQPGSTLTVKALGAGAVVTGLVVKVFQVRPGDPLAANPILIKRGGR